MEENTVLCGANAYTKKYFFNEQFNILPQRVKDELHIMCVMFTEEISGIFTVEFDDKGNLELKTESMAGDGMYDEIGATLCIKKLQDEKRDLFESLELFYKVFTGEGQV
ncbi:MAG: DUF6145 family protein [Eubacterium sp.]|nr:DUF6145 family protein [Eubacterium sp.]